MVTPLKSCSTGVQVEFDVPVGIRVAAKTAVTVGAVAVMPTLKALALGRIITINPIVVSASTLMMLLHTKSLFISSLLEITLFHPLHFIIVPINGDHPVLFFLSYVPFRQPGSMCPYCGYVSSQSVRMAAQRDRSPPSPRRIPPLPLNDRPHSAI